MTDLHSRRDAVDMQRLSLCFTADTVLSEAFICDQNRSYRMSLAGFCLSNYAMI